MKKNEKSEKNEKNEDINQVVSLHKINYFILSNLFNCKFK